MLSIPDELLLHIFEFLSPEENDPNLQAVSRRFRGISQSDLLWGPRVMQLWKDQASSRESDDVSLPFFSDSDMKQVKQVLLDVDMKMIQLVSAHQGAFATVTPWRKQYENMRFQDVNEVLWVSQTDGARFPSPRSIQATSSNRFWIELEGLVSGPDYDAMREWHRRVLQHESFCLHLCGNKWAIWPDGSRLCDSKCPLSIARVTFEQHGDDNKQLIVTTRTPLHHRAIKINSVVTCIFNSGSRITLDVKNLQHRRPGIWRSEHAIVWQCGFSRFNSQELKEWIELNQEGKIAREQEAESKGFCGALHGPGDDSFGGLLKYECRHRVRSGLEELELIQACEKCAVKWQKENGCMACPECITPLGQNEAMYERDESGFKRRKVLRPKYLDSV